MVERGWRNSRQLWHVNHRKISSPRRSIGTSIPRLFGVSPLFSPTVVRRWKSRISIWTALLTLVNLWIPFFGMSTVCTHTCAHIYIYMCTHYVSRLAFVVPSTESYKVHVRGKWKKWRRWTFLRNQSISPKDTEKSSFLNDRDVPSSKDKSPCDVVIWRNFIQRTRLEQSTIESEKVATKNWCAKIARDIKRFYMVECKRTRLIICAFEHLFIYFLID